MSTPIKTGLIFGEPSELYHGNNAVSSSKLSDFRIAGKLCPRNYQLRHVTKTVERKKGDYFDFGIFTHAQILEGPEAFKAITAFEPATYTNEKGEVKPWSNNAKVCKEWHEKQAGKIVLTKADAVLVNTLDAAVFMHPEARALTREGTAEVTFRKVIAGMTLQCRVDKWHPNGVPCLNIEGPVMADLKTCNTIEQFEKDFYYKRYNFRCAFYLLVAQEVLAELAGVKPEEIPAPDYVFVVVEKSPPYRVKIYRPDTDSLEAGKKEVHADLVTLRNCMAANEWPTGTEGVHEIGLQTWQLAKSNDASDAAINAA